MDKPLSAYEAPQTISPVGPYRLAQELGVGGRDGVERDRVKMIPIVAIEHTVRGLAQGRRLSEHRVEHGCEVAGRRIDDLQDLGGRGLLLQRLVTLGFALGKLTLEIGYE